MAIEIVQRTQSWIDILNCAERIEADSPNAAERFFDAIEESFEFLSRFPEAASVIETEDDRVAGLRLWPMKRFPRHLILYRYRDDRVEVLRIIHASQDIAPILEDL
jgi:toxin ParE1/3/4